MSVLIVTSVGDIVVDLHTDRCSLTTKNFIKLCKMKYYNGCLFHKVEKDFMAQSGDRTGTGNGGDSVYKFLYGDQARFFDDEIHPDLKHSKMGTLAMASAGKNCNASQFYFTLRDDLDYLDGKHTVFGIVEEQEGLDTLTKINEVFVDENGRPLKNVRIKHTYILDDPFSDPAQLTDFIPENSPEGKPDDESAEERLEDNWVPLADTLGTVELEEAIRVKEAHTNAAILESIGDIPDADIKPPENVLFVCKLNPVTQDEDLHTIFSRFGNVVSADIIRDFKTGDSLCYAFIEFEIQEACELAYYKMDNTLIDDRRIHVDFSQSVSKLWSQYRQGKRSQNKGDGCFKCGAADHIAKNCDQESGNKFESTKYTLKEGNTQRGGGHKSYDMVFDEDNLETPDGNNDQSKKKEYDRQNPDSRSNKHRQDDEKKQASKKSEERHERSNRAPSRRTVELQDGGRKRRDDRIMDKRSMDVGRRDNEGNQKRKNYDSREKDESRYNRDIEEHSRRYSSHRRTEEGQRERDTSGREYKEYGRRDERRHDRHERR
ncbi:Peptidyl-prolyl cis-trans isomerase-like protein [Zostera marina]|uniref:Peptidyl-prolyl cis-trans isomerase n=1 Tax=Zostera marina TaxID=29655 RepID=A0A0K9NZ63_ZOSMR|nr:Peptidyl-prolyl cis-trans isomerase-like protein [Zostera marina]